MDRLPDRPFISVEHPRSKAKNTVIVSVEPIIFDTCARADRQRSHIGII
jgi:hypothetical protein